MYFINKIEDFWHGNIGLWKSYWLVGELFNAIVIIIILNIELKLFNNTHFFINLPIISFNQLHFVSKFIIFVWTILITVGIWRSAEKYNGKLIWTILTLIILSYRLFVLKEIIY